MAPNDVLPPQPLNGDTESSKSYYRRRIDELVDRRLHTIETQLKDLDERTDTLATRLNWFFGGLAVVITLANLLGKPIADLIVRALTGTP